MENYSDLLQRIKTLNSCRKKKLIVDIYKMIYSKKDTSKDIDLKCPFCGNLHIVKNGRNKNKQRYLCKHCRKSFIFETNTPIYHSKKNISLWIDFLDCLFKQYSVRKTARILNICPTTAFFWRHKILDALKENDKINSLKKQLTGTIMSSEITFKESFKGNHSKSKFKMPRPPYNKPSSPIEEFGKRRISVLIATDKNNEIFEPVSIGKALSSDIMRCLNNKIKEDSLLISDMSRSEYDYKLEASFLSLKYSFSRNNNAYDINIANSFGAEIKLFLTPYRGVATKYLSNYIGLFKKAYIKSKKERNTNKNDEIVHFDDICPLFIKKSSAYFLKHFKNRMPTFD